MEAELTSPGTTVGTVAYLSPEQATGLDVDARPGIFSFGVVLYEMVTANQPFSGRTPASTFDAILHSDPAPLRRKNGEVSPELNQIIRRMLAKNRAKRYQTMTELLADLRR